MNLRWYARREKPDFHPHDIGAFGYLAWSDEGYNVWVTLQYEDEGSLSGKKPEWKEIPVVDESGLEEGVSGGEATPTKD